MSENQKNENKSEENQLPEVVVGKKTSEEYTDPSKVKPGVHVGQITQVKVVTPEENHYKNYQLRLLVTFPQFSEEGKFPPGLFWNITVLAPQKDKDEKIIAGDDGNPVYRSTVFEGSSSKAAKTLEAIGFEVKEGLKITPEMFENKKLGASVVPHTNTKGEKVKKIDAVFSKEEVEDEEDDSSSESNNKTEQKSSDQSEEKTIDYYSKALNIFNNDKEKLEEKINEKYNDTGGAIERDKIIEMIAKGVDF